MHVTQVQCGLLHYHNSDRIDVDGPGYLPFGRQPEGACDERSSSSSSFSALWEDRSPLAHSATTDDTTSHKPTPLPTLQAHTATDTTIPQAHSATDAASPLRYRRYKPTPQPTPQAYSAADDTSPLHCCRHRTSLPMPLPMPLPLRTPQPTPLSTPPLGCSLLPSRRLRFVQISPLALRTPPTSFVQLSL